MKIAYIAPYEGESERVTARLQEHDVVFLPEPIRTHVPATIQDAEVVSLFVDSTLTADMLADLPRLQHIALRSTGFDHVDQIAAAERGITMSYVPHYGSQTVAEFTFALILALSRKAYAAYDALRHSGVVDVKAFEGFDLAGKTIGVVGTGAIGRHVCKMAHGFGMTVLAFDTYPDPTSVAPYGVTYCSLEELLAQSDIVSLHIPSAPESHHLINQDRLQMMKEGAYLINTARGDLVDTVALTKAITSGQLAGAGLDVFEGEQYIKDEMELLQTDPSKDTASWQAFVAEHELLDRDNVIVTPHIAFNSIEAKREITDTTISNILAGRAVPSEHLVPPVN